MHIEPHQSEPAAYAAAKTILDHAKLDGFDAVVVAAGARAPRGLSAANIDAPGVVYAVDYLTASTVSVLDGGEPAVNARGLDVVVIGGGDTGNDCVGTAVHNGKCYR